MELGGFLIELLEGVFDVVGKTVIDCIMHLCMWLVRLIISEIYGFGAQEHRKKLKWLKDLLRTTPAYYEPMKDSGEFWMLVLE